MFPKRIHNQKTPTELIQTLLQRRMAASEHKHFSLQNRSHLIYSDKLFNLHHGSSINVASYNNSRLFRIISLRRKRRRSPVGHKTQLESSP